MDVPREQLPSDSTQPQGLLEIHDLPEPRLPFEIEDIRDTPEDQANRDWEVTVNGEPIDKVTSLTLKNRKTGVSLTYGERSEGYDGPVMHEPGGGGAVTIPYMISSSDGKLYVGLVREYRGPAGGFVLNVPRGFLDLGEIHKEAAVRELKEETGLPVLADRITQFSSGLNPNTAFFDTSRNTQDGTPEGAAIFGLHVYPDEVDAVTNEDGSTYYRFKREIRDQADGYKPAENIVGSLFVPVETANRSADMYTHAAIGDLMIYLLGCSALGVLGVHRPN